MPVLCIQRGREGGRERERERVSEREGGRERETFGPALAIEKSSQKKKV